MNPPIKRKQNSVMLFATIYPVLLPIVSLIQSTINSVFLFGLSNIEQQSCSALSRVVFQTHIHFNGVLKFQARLRCHQFTVQIVKDQLAAECRQPRPVESDSGSARFAPKQTKSVPESTKTHLRGKPRILAKLSRFAKWHSAQDHYFRGQ